jgi:thymidylate kinase
VFTPFSLALEGENRDSGAMAERDEAVLVTGLYGSGKSSLVAEMAERMEAADISFGAIDVDWLTWYHLPAAPGVRHEDLRSQNLSDVARRYLSAGVRRLLLAEAVRGDDDVAAIRQLLPCPVRVVLLDLPIAVIDARLRGDPTTGRAHDLRVAHDWVSRGLGKVTADLVLDAQAPLTESAERVLDWAGWLPARSGS